MELLVWGLCLSSWNEHGHGGPAGMHMNMVLPLQGSGQQGTAQQSAAKTEPPEAQNIGDEVTGTSPEIVNDPATGTVPNAKRVRTARGARPGLLMNLSVGACLLVATLGTRTNVVKDELPSLPTYRMVPKVLTLWMTN